MRLPLGGVIDLDAEKARLSKAAEAAEKERDGLAARLANPNFTERAKPEAVEKARADHDAKSAEAERLSGGAGAARLSLRRGDRHCVAVRRSPRAGWSRRFRRRSRLASAGAWSSCQLAPAELAHRLVPRVQLDRRREIAPAEADDASAGHRLDDDLAAFDVGAFDQLDPAMEAAVGDPHLGRP